MGCRNASSANPASWCNHFTQGKAHLPRSCFLRLLRGNFLTLPFESLKWSENYLLLKVFWESEGKTRNVIMHAWLCIFFVSKTLISLILFSWGLVSVLSYPLLNMLIILNFHQHFLRTLKYKELKLSTTKYMHNWGNL